MKSPLTNFVAAVVLTAFVTVQAHAQITRDKKPPGGLGGLTTPVNKKTAAESDPLPKIDVLGRLTIKSFGIFRPDRPPIAPGVARDTGIIVGVISSNATQPLEATYTFSRLIGKTWTTIGESKTVTVPAKKTVDVSPPFPSGAAPERLRLVVTNTAHKVYQVQELRLDTVKVRCSAVDWVPVDVKEELSVGRAPDKAAEVLKYFGFEVQHRRSESGTSVRLALWARLEAESERSFYSQMWADMHAQALSRMLYGAASSRGKVEVIRR